MQNHRYGGSISTRLLLSFKRLVCASWSPYYYIAHYLQRLSELELETHLLGGGGRCQVQSLCYKVKIIDNVCQKITANPVI